MEKGTPFMGCSEKGQPIFHASPEPLDRDAFGIL
jgi:hypothetical protein